ncbi:hypothetical protein [Actinomadura sp. 6N118]|uniref:hypothetical protein n=1 Tax=Actinomadura sp. 6N118 TaxID=3375151 RepID=UPI003788E886
MPAGDYAGWTWQQIQEAINAGDPTSLEWAGDYFDYTLELIDDAGGTVKDGSDTLAGPGGSWKGPAATAFVGLTTELATHVVGLADTLAGPPSYQTTLDKAAQDLRDAQEAVKQAMANAAQDTVDAYNNEVTAYNNAATAFNEGNGPNPGVPPLTPSIAGPNGTTIVDVNRYPAITEALNEEMRAIIGKLAGDYTAAGGALTDPGDAPVPSPADLPAPPVKGDVPPPGAVPPPGETVPPPGALPETAAPNLVDGPPPGEGVPAPEDLPQAAVPPGDIAPIVPANDDFNLVTEPGALNDAANDPANQPQFVQLNPNAGAPAPILSGLNTDAGNGVLGDPINNPPLTADGSPFGGAGLLAPSVLGGGLSPIGQNRPSPSLVETPSAPGSPRSPLGPGMMPPVGGAYGLMSTGPDGKSRMLPADTFGDDTGNPTRRDRLTGGEGMLPFAGSPYGDDENERDRKREYTEGEEAVWGSDSSASTLGR